MESPIVRRSSREQRSSAAAASPGHLSHPHLETVVVGLLVLGTVAIVGLIVACLVALRPTTINADHGSEVDYSTRVDGEVSLPDLRAR